MEQAIKLTSVGNARELGGYRVGDRVIKKGLLLRTASLAAISEEDKRVLLDEYKLGAIADLRMGSEIAIEPDPAMSDVCHQPLSVMEMSDYPGFDEEEMAKFLASKEDRLGVVLQSIEMGMMDAGLYADFVLSDRGRKAYRGVFRLLLDTPEDRAVLWHCTDGKDRTGVAAMLILSALGADWETILADYLLTNTYNAEKIQQAKRLIAPLNLDPEKEKRLLFGMGAVYEEYIAAAMRAIEENYGSIDRYLDEELGVHEDGRRELQDRFLAQNYMGIKL